MASWRVAQKMQMSREEVTWNCQTCDRSTIGEHSLPGDRVLFAWWVA
jgi:hypothetical protein